VTLVRHPGGPVLTLHSIPPIPPMVVDPSSVFNPGVATINGEIRFLLRVQNRGRQTFLVPARSVDGIEIEVLPQVVEVRGLDLKGETAFHIYDPRITVVEGEPLVTLAIDTEVGCRTAVARWPEPGLLEVISVDLERDVRNAVLFPDRIGGRYVRLERPNRVTREGALPSGSAVTLATSDDLITWEPGPEVFAGRPRYWDELIGSGPPPVKTKEGWLHLYHGVATHFASTNLYQAGAVLLDLDDPSKVLKRTSQNILEPRETWELTGQVPNVVFPSGMIAEDGPDGRVLVYYGAADTSVGLAVSTVSELIDACN
jgi:beta-1,4-mannooligosaccharide/beta-1,4-mannosyl-N-acetylglucosamine phosphorylase